MAQSRTVPGIQEKARAARIIPIALVLVVLLPVLFAQSTKRVAGSSQSVWDARGNLYLTSVAGGRLTVQRYAPNFVKAWHVQLNVPADTRIFAIATDSAGRAYVAGMTQSSEFLKPDPSWARDDVILLRLGIDGKLEASRRLGGAGTDAVYGAAVNSTDDTIYLAGTTDSIDGAFERKSSGTGKDVFVVALSATDLSQRWIRYLGGKVDEEACCLAVDPAGQVFVAGTTTSSDFTIKDGWRPFRAGARDLFLASMDGKDGRLRWSTYFGGSLDEQAAALVAVGQDDVVLFGTSDSEDLPLAGGPAVAPRGGMFLARFPSSGGAPRYVSLVGKDAGIPTALMRQDDRSLLAAWDNAASRTGQSRLGLFDLDGGQGWGGFGIVPQRLSVLAEAGLIQPKMTTPSAPSKTSPAHAAVSNTTAATVSIAVAPSTFDPQSFTSLGALSASGAIAFNTDTLTYSGGGSPGVLSNGVAVFTFSSITLNPGSIVTVAGSRPLGLLSQGNIAIHGIVDASGQNATDMSETAVSGGPGGGAGGQWTTAQAPGGGPGGGQAVAGAGYGTSFGGGGGSFGGYGGRGGASGGLGGAVYGDLKTDLQGGSGGASGTRGVASPIAASGGGGGGAILLGATGNVVIGAAGALRADGGSGGFSGKGASGGGSGGGVYLKAASIVNDGAISAAGGNGGTGGCCGGGGGGGGGRIVLEGPLTGSGSVTASGGLGGSGNTAGMPGSAGVVISSGPSFSFPSSGTTAPYTAGSNSVAVTASDASANWTASSNQSWLTITAGATGTGNGLVTFSYSENSSAYPRTATIAVGSTTYTITQNGAPASLSFPSSGVRVGNWPETGIVTLNVTPFDAPWTVSSDRYWLTITSSASGSGPTYVGYSYPQNPSGAAREATITATSGSSVATYLITQAASFIRADFNPSSANPPARDGSGTVGVIISPEGALWGSVTSDRSWLTVDASTGSGNGTIAYSYTPNNSFYPRVGHISVGLSDFTVTQAGDTPLITVGPSSSSVTAASSAGTFSINIVPSDSPFTISTAASWITLESGLSGTGSGTVSYAVAQTNSVNPRTGTVTVTSGSVTKTYTIIQAGGTPVITLTPASGGPTADPGTGSFTVSASLADAAFTAVSSDPWLTITAGSGGTGTGSVSYAYTRNSSINGRTAAITVLSGVVTKTFTVTQAGAVPVITLTPAAKSVSSGAGTGSFDVSLTPADAPFTTATPAGWINIVNGGSGTGSGTVRYSYGANDASASRTGTISVMSGSVTAAFTITQHGSAPVITVTPNSANPGPAAGSAAFTVSISPADVPFSASTTGTWISLTGGASGTGSGTVNYSYTQNASVASRTGAIIVTAGASTATFTITQSGAQPVITLAPASASHTASAGIGSTGVTVTPADAAFTAATGSAWINVTGGASGTGSATITYSYAQNAGDSTRTGTITVASGAVTAAFTVTQTAGSAPVVTLTPFSASPASSAGSGSFTVNIVPTSSPFTATTAASWITLLAGVSGTGAGTVNYAYTQNNSVNSRTAVIAVASGPVTSIFSIEQSGATPVYSLLPSSDSRSAAAGSGTIAVNATPPDAPWTAVSNQPWLTISSGSSGTGPGTIGYSFAANPSGSPRTATVAVSGTIFTLTQAGNGTPDLTIVSTHAGNMAQGQTGAAYTLTVTNVGGAATAGTVTVWDILPAAMSATAIGGPGWSCTLPNLTCIRTDSLAPAGSYPPVTITVNVAAQAPASVVNVAHVTGGGDSNTANNSASDPTTILTGVPVTFQTAPEGLSFSLDGVSYTSPVTLPLAAGSTHLLATVQEQSRENGVRYIFSGWSHAAAISGILTVPATPRTYTASFDTQYLLVTIADPPYGGTVTPSAAYFNANTVAALQATPNEGYQFSGWTGFVSINLPASSITMSSPWTVTARFAPANRQTITISPIPDKKVGDPPFPVTATASSGLPVTLSIASGPASIAGNVVTLTGPGNVVVAAAQPGDAGNPPASASWAFRVLSADVPLTLASNPSEGGSVTAEPGSATGLYPAGSSTRIKATANAGYLFVGFSGDLSGTANSQWLVLSQERTVTANFAPISTDPADQITFGLQPGGSFPTPLEAPFWVPEPSAMAVIPGGAESWLAVSLTPLSTLRLSLGPSASALTPGSYTSYVVLTYGGSRRVITVRLLVGNAAITSVVNSASYRAQPLASESLFTIFGVNLGPETVAASSSELSETLGGVSVTIADASGVIRKAALLYVSPAQVNLITPPSLMPGAATLTLANRSGIITSTPVQIGPVSPGLFTADQNGAGLASAHVLRVHADGSTTLSRTALCDAAAGVCTALPVDLGGNNEQVYLSLYGTGFRGRSGLSGVSVTIGAMPAGVTYAGAQPQFAGVDQLNVAIPTSLALRGEVEIKVIIDGAPANPVSIVTR